MNKKTILITALLILVGITTALYYLKPTAQTSPEQEVRDVVAAFGKQLQFVSPLGPSDVTIKAVDEHYGPYISPTLLAAWHEHPEKAPGRLTSNPPVVSNTEPYPDHIKIILIEKAEDGAYDVQARIVEVTTADPTKEAASHPIALKLRNQNNRWVITGFASQVLN